MSMSRSQLYRKIHALTGMSPNEFIRYNRLQKAAELLSHHTGNISEAAYEVGFSNPSYFSECFKKQFGVLPSDYQKENSK
jgi:AraC-like DNA-binding protein